MGRYKSDFAEPPWVYSPTEVMKWINATPPIHKVKKFHVEKEEKFLKNIELSLDINVEKSVVPSNFFLKKIEYLTGYKKIEENFEIIPTAELIARALAKAKFKNMMRIVLDGKVIYEHPEKGNDIRKTIEMLADMAYHTKKGKTIELQAMDNKSIAEIIVKKVHPKKKHAVDIKIKGRIKEELFHRFLNYLKEHLPVEVIK